MPIDAQYLYKTGEWETPERLTRIGSECFDYVGRCYADGVDTSCLMVKFACHPGEFNDADKWYVYPSIVSDEEIWGILQFEWESRMRSVGRGYHRRIPAAIRQADFLKIAVPSCRVYRTVHNLDTGISVTSYFRIRPFSDISLEWAWYAVCLKIPGGYIVDDADFIIHCNSFDERLRVARPMPAHGAWFLWGFNADSSYYHGDLRHHFKDSFLRVSKYKFYSQYHTNTPRFFGRIRSTSITVLGLMHEGDPWAYTGNGYQCRSPLLSAYSDRLV